MGGRPLGSPFGSFASTASASFRCGSLRSTFPRCVLASATRPWPRVGTRIKVLFEDREIIAGPGFFVDDFRGEDLYQRFGGGPGVGYGGAPVALHIYEIP